MSDDAVEDQLIPFDTLANQFVEQGALVSPSEVHGTLCGMLSAGERMAPAQWLASTLEQLGLEAFTCDGLPANLTELYRVTLGQMETQGFELQLLLPDDDEGVAQRAESLGLWCHGFMAGYSLAGGSHSKGLSEDGQDALADFTEISRITAADQEEDESEADFAEVSEYVRMAALLLFSECNQGREQQCAPPGTALH